MFVRALSYPDVVLCMCGVWVCVWLPCMFEPRHLFEIEKILFKLVNRGMNNTFDSQHVRSGSAGSLHPSTRVLACLKRLRYVVAELMIFLSDD